MQVPVYNVYKLKQGASHHKRGVAMRAGDTIRLPESRFIAAHLADRLELHGKSTDRSEFLDLDAVKMAEVVINCDNLDDLWELCEIEELTRKRKPVLDLLKERLGELG